jgi:hypothetical protein
MNFKMFQNGNIPQIAVRLLLRFRGEKPFDELPDHVEVQEEATVAVVPDTHGALVWVRTDVSGMAIITPVRLAVLDTIIMSAKSIYGEREKSPTLRTMDRSALEHLVGEQQSEIIRLREVIAAKGDWHFTDAGRVDRNAS